MDHLRSLPPELFLIILDYVLGAEYEYPRQGARYSTVSRQFQYFVERRIFKSLQIDNLCLRRALRLFRPAQAHRKAFVRWLRFSIELPSYSFEDSTRVETEDEKEANSQVFSDAIHGLFRILKSLDESEDLRNAGGLQCSMDTAPAPKSDREFGTVDHEKRGSIRGKRSRASLLRLRDAEQLPAVSIVWRLHLGNWHGERYLDPLATMAIATKLNRLRYAVLNCYDKDYLDIATRRTNRVGMEPRKLVDLQISFR